ncbi:hypothetical protein [Spongiactinospora sp. TRM90649]|uniref:hypothetical protein n=1 Tax=Spongiactinospora sp. TRM90649 TaxID=3031114 RepID=UPI0023F83017|nr:hypothetical protein [Spongiactinospora sp. TRM90649]MDF5755211.1 hypothetical protein [Spongiactinospora sp. TRM90649]
MRLTWKDAVTTVTMAVITALYVAYVQGVDVLFISGARWTAGAILLLGAAGGCAMGSADELYQGPRTAAVRTYTAIISVVGATALVAALVALITGNAIALAILFYGVAAMWLMATVRHALPGPTDFSGRDHHEVIGPEEVRRH